MFIDGSKHAREAYRSFTPAAGVRERERPVRAEPLFPSPVHSFFSVKGKNSPSENRRIKSLDRTVIDAALRDEKGRWTPSCLTTIGTPNPSKAVDVGPITLRSRKGNFDVVEWEVVLFTWE